MQHGGQDSRGSDVINDVIHDVIHYVIHDVIHDAINESNWKVVISQS